MLLAIHFSEWTKEAQGFLKNPIHYHSAVNNGCIEVRFVHFCLSDASPLPAQWFPHLTIPPSFMRVAAPTHRKPSPITSSFKPT